MPTIEEQADKLVDLINSSEFAVAFTGAGISTESGIPDYRSPGTGLWEKMDQSVVSLGGLLNKPSAYYDYAAELYPVRSAAKPKWKRHFRLCCAFVSRADVAPRLSGRSWTRWRTSVPTAHCG